MNHQSAAKVLEELMLDLIEKGAEIPEHVVEDLKTGRSLASIHQRQPDDPDIEMKTGAALENVEMNLLSLVESISGWERAEEWQKQINIAYQEEPAPKAPTCASKFVPGAPKGQYWIRIQASELAAAEKWEELLNELSLLAVSQEDGYLLISGKKADVIAFLDQIRQKVGKMECKRDK